MMLLTRLLLIVILKYIIALISVTYLFLEYRFKSVGLIEKIAEDFECSVRTVKRMLNSLRYEGHNICYCKKSNKYLLKN